MFEEVSKLWDCPIISYRKNGAVGSLVVRASDSRTWSPIQFHAKIVEVDIGGVAIYHSFEEFRRAKNVLSPVWCSRPTTGVPLAHATMNFVGLDLTTSDSYTRAFGDGPRNFEPWSITWTTPELASPSPNYHTTPTGGRFSSRQI
ncbi:hypothetical protein TNCV_2489471 [Trichonephila clavipes]|nr:hypothetical protein TNCV_2489471 [Trichonephila clavipes]